jgi:endonuclease YncB( thermonuclease family)
MATASRARITVSAGAVGFPALCSILLAGIGDAQAPRALTGQVVKVVDGDTIHVRVGTHVAKVAPDASSPLPG